MNYVCQNTECGKELGTSYCYVEFYRIDVIPVEDGQDEFYHIDCAPQIVIDDWFSTDDWGASRIKEYRAANGNVEVPEELDNDDFEAYFEDYDECVYCSVNDFEYLRGYSELSVHERRVVIGDNELCFAKCECQTKGECKRECENDVSCDHESEYTKQLETA